MKSTRMNRAAMDFAFIGLVFNWRSFHFVQIQAIILIINRYLAYMIPILLIFE